MKLCVFQGTFNPIHNAHIRLANYVVNKYDFDKLLFIPAYKPPHKNTESSLAEHRLNMVKVGLQNFKKLEVSDIEYQRKGKSYTILTIKELYEKYKIEGKIYFIIGTDAFRNIETWYKADELKDLVTFILFEREENFNIEEFEYLKKKGYDFELQDLDYEDISSSKLRLMLKSGQNVDKYIPQLTQEYIKKYELYKY